MNNTFTVKFQFAAQCAMTMRARYGSNRYPLTRLGNVTEEAEFVQQAAPLPRHCEPVRTLAWHSVLLQCAALRRP